jgi:nucleoside-diphosphate-sugar epimerase
MNRAGYEGMRRVPDTSKIKALMGWQPTISLDQTLDEVIGEFRVG